MIMQKTGKGENGHAAALRSRRELGVRREHASSSANVVEAISGQKIDAFLQSRISARSA
jgi:hypothetical protein